METFQLRFPLKKQKSTENWQCLTNLKMETTCSSYYTQTISHPCKAGHLVIAIICSYIYIYVCVCDHQVDFRKKWGFMFALLQLPRWPKSKFWVGMQRTHYTQTSWGSKMTEFYTYVPIFSQQFSILAHQTASSVSECTSLSLLVWSL